ncbi:hypothetical protein C8R46DRAFT_1347034 [Mycena filopes]|nr:hypothetical protein C8R46DRAFT_1347034 [Mycena filopes]
MSSNRRLSLHPSALSDAEYTLFTASLGELLDVDATSTNGAIDWERLSVSVREARAWLCGRYAGLGSGVVDEILRLFPAPTLGGGAFFAALRLVLHAQAGRGVDRSLAFVQAPVPTAPSPPTSNTAYNPFLPTPAPSPEYRPRKPVALAPPPRSAPSSNASSSSASEPSSPRRHAYSSSLSLSLSLAPAPPPPTHPLRRASTHSTHSSPASSSHSSHYPRPIQTQNQNPTPPSSNDATSVARNANPFRRPPPPALPPRRASTSTPVSPTTSSPNAQFAVFAGAGREYEHARTAPPTRGAFFPPSPVPPPVPPPSANPYLNRSGERDGEREGGFNVHGRARTQPASGSPFDAAPPPGAAVSRRASGPPVHPQRGDTLNTRHPNSNSHTQNHHNHTNHNQNHTPALPLALPKALRRTLAGAGWDTGAQHGEQGRYTARNARRGEEERGEAWGAL